MKYHDLFVIFEKAAKIGGALRVKLFAYKCRLLIGFTNSLDLVIWIWKVWHSDGIPDRIFRKVDFEKNINRRQKSLQNCPEGKEQGLIDNMISPWQYLPIWALRPFCGTKANSADPDQKPQKAASGQGRHCLLTESSIKIWLKMQNKTQ